MVFFVPKCIKTGFDQKINKKFKTLWLTEIVSTSKRYIFTLAYILNVQFTKT